MELFMAKKKQSQQKSSERRLDQYLELLEEDLLYASTRSDAQAFAIERQLDRCRKKAVYVRQELRAKAEADFISLNDRLGDLVIDLPRGVVENAQWFIVRALWGFTKKNVPESIQETLDLGLLFGLWRFGKGASSSDVPDPHPAVKMGHGMTTTSNARDLVLMLRRWDDHFARIESCEDTQRNVTEVQGSIFDTVHKNQTSYRPIAKEPTGNMCLQLAGGEYVSGALRWVGLDIRDQQPKNNRLARLGSISNELATLDLKDASSMQTMKLIELLWPREWYNFMMSVRSPSMQIGEEWINLNMMSTMGNGFTFPVMTMTILALLYGYRCCRGGPRNRIDWSITGVFGDDIILQSSEAEEFIDILHRAGYVVNVDKSFVVGPFRESCGGDYWNGVDVTPFYVKNLRHDADVYKTLNRAIEWACAHDLYLYRSNAYLRTLLEGELFLVPEWMPVTAGIRYRFGPRRFSYLHANQVWMKLDETDYAERLYIGGFLSSAGGNFGVLSDKLRKRLGYDAADMLYLPRPHQQGYSVRRSRLASCYLDGWDPLERSDRASHQRAFLVDLLIK